jgi:predicted transcriptional regulator
MSALEIRTLRFFLAVIRENLDRAEACPADALAHFLSARAAITEAINAGEAEEERRGT